MRRHDCLHPALVAGVGVREGVMGEQNVLMDETERIRLEVAYLLWQVNEGYICAEDRAVGSNWMLDDPSTFHPDDAAELPGWLEAADEVIRIVRDLSGASGRVDP